jgi:HK97 family phage portal protein
MKFWSKIKNIFSKKESAVANIIVNPGSGGTIWTTEDYENFAKETYVKNIIAYRSISMVANSCSSVPWKLFRRLSNGENEEVTDHPILKITKRPNPDDGIAFLVIQIFAYLLIAGNVYIEKISPLTGDNKDIPLELYVLRPDRMVINVNEHSGRKTGYTYTIGGRSYRFEVDKISGRSNILHLKTFHPLDDWYGLATTRPAAREIDTSNEATTWNKKLLENEGRPGMVFTVVGNLSKQQYDRLEKRLKEEYSGASNAHKNLILEGEKGTGVAPFGFSPADLDFIEGNKELSRKIANAYGVPPQLIGIPEANTYSNYQEARLAFWEDTIIPWLNYLKDELNNWFFSGETDTDLFLNYDLNNVPALAPKREMMWKRAQESDFLKIDEKRELTGFPVLENGVGDVVLIPANMLPIGSEPTEEEESEEVITDEDEKNITELIEQGYTREEALEMIGVPEGSLL